MQRILAKVLEVKRGKRGKDRLGFQFSQVECLVRIRGTARKTIRLPKGIIGKTAKISRQCLLPWEIKTGDYLVLDPQESKRVIAELLPTSHPRKAQPNMEHALLYSQDVDGDGFKEDILENAFLKAVIAPHYGARLWQLQTKSKKQNQLLGSGNYGRDGWVELGGVEESISGVEKPDELWNAEYKREGSKRQPTFNYRFSCEKKEGLEVEKSVSIEPDLPLVYQVSEFKYKGREKDEKLKKKVSIEYCPKVFFAMGGEANFHNLFFVPTREKLVKARYHKPAWKGRWEDEEWEWREKWSCIDPGFVLLSNEKRGDSLAILFHPGKISFARLGISSRSPRLFLSHSPRKLKKGARVSFGILFALADVYDLSQEDLLLLSLGELSSAGYPLAIILRTSKRYRKCSVTLDTDGHKRRLDLNPRIYAEVGKVFQRSLTIPQGFSSVSATFDHGKESLRCGLKGV